MTKAKTDAAEAEKPPVDPAAKGQDTLAASDGTAGPDATGADIPPAAETEDQNPPAPTAEELAAAAAEKAEADAREKAEVEAAAAVRAAKAKKARAKKLDLPTLDYCANHIATRNFTGLRAELVEELTDSYGLQVETDDDTGQVKLAMQGISIDPADTLETALANWSNAARRHIAQATA